MTSKEQFRALFQENEPELLGFLDAMIAEFGRDGIKDLKVHCPLPKNTETEKS